MLSLNTPALISTAQAQSFTLLYYVGVPEQTGEFIKRISSRHMQPLEQV